MRIAKPAGMKKAAVALARQTRRHHASDARRWHAVHDPAGVAPCLAPSRTSRLVAVALRRPSYDGACARRSRSRDDGSGQAAIQADGKDHAHTRLADLSSSNPVRWRPRADPERKHDASSRSSLTRCTSGIDNPEPVTELQKLAVLGLVGSFYNGSPLRRGHS
jgi:hypothetical protein